MSEKGDVESEGEIASVAEGASGNDAVAVGAPTNSLSLDSITFNRLARGQCYYSARSSQSAE